MGGPIWSSPTCRRPKPGCLTIRASIRIGATGAADVRLPADCPAGELRLACQLLAQIVECRRRERQAVEIQRSLSQQALSDPLTGLPNRRAWDEALAERSTPAAGRLCLAILDLDHFKEINDLHGHAIGDEVLRAAGQAVCDNLRHGDFVARLGGDEFGLLLWVADDQQAAAVVERVRSSLPERFARTGLPRVTASAGYRLTDGVQPAGSAEALYAAADASLREAKLGGRDRTVGPGSRGQGKGGRGQDLVV